MAFGGQVTEQDFSRKAPALHARILFRTTSVGLFRLTRHAGLTLSPIRSPESRAVFSAVDRV